MSSYYTLNSLTQEHWLSLTQSSRAEKEFPLDSSSDQAQSGPDTTRPCGTRSLSDYCLACLWSCNKVPLSERVGKANKRCICVSAGSTCVICKKVFRFWFSTLLKKSIWIILFFVILQFILRWTFKINYNQQIVPFLFFLKVKRKEMAQFEKMLGAVEPTKSWISKLSSRSSSKLGGSGFEVVMWRGTGP